MNLLLNGEDDDFEESEPAPKLLADIPGPDRISLQQLRPLADIPGPDRIPLQQLRPLADIPGPDRIPLQQLRPRVYAALAWVYALLSRGLDRVIAYVVAQRDRFRKASARVLGNRGNGMGYAGQNLSHDPQTQPQAQLSAAAFNLASLIRAKSNEDQAMKKLGSPCGGSAVALVEAMDAVTAQTAVIARANARMVKVLADAKSRKSLTKKQMDLVRVIEAKLEPQLGKES